MLASSNTQRTLDYLRKDGYTVWIVERFLAFAGKYGKRQDLFNIIDIIAIQPGETLGVQSTGQGFSEHHKTIMDGEYTGEWLQAGNGLMLIGWRKVKKERGKAAMVWKPRVRCYYLGEETEIRYVDEEQK